MLVFTVLSRWTLFATLWVILAGGAIDSLPYGLAASGVATSLSLSLYPANLPGLVAWRLVLFLPRFLMQGIVGGVDVAGRAVGPQVVNPGWVSFPLRSRDDAANVLLGGVISVLPGTLAAGPGDGTVDVHVLNLSGFSISDLSEDERRIVDLFDPPVEPMVRAHG
jgi:multicomponent Na+:H+ antiporter subunit E